MNSLFTFVLLSLALVTISALPFGSDRIVGGSNAPAGEYPYQVSLRNYGSHFCGGSIINKRYILTAAHCVKGQSAGSMTVVAGTNSLQETGDRYNVEALIPNKKFSSLRLTNDIALIRLASDITFNSKVQPIELPTSDNHDYGYDAILSGWGRLSAGGTLPTMLQHITLTVISNTVCKLSVFGVTSTQVCTLTRAGEGACNGDSGGPLVADGVQVGIVSYGTPCARGRPDVFTRVSSFIGWIKENTK